MTVPKMKPRRLAPYSDLRRYWISWRDLNLYIYGKLNRRKGLTRIGSLVLSMFRLAISVSSAKITALLAGIVFFTAFVVEAWTWLIQLPLWFLVLTLVVALVIAVASIWHLAEANWVQALLRKRQIHVDDDVELKVKLRECHPDAALSGDGYRLVAMLQTGECVHRSEQVDSFLRHSRLTLCDDPVAMLEVMERLRTHDEEMEDVLRYAWRDAMDNKRDFRNEEKLCLTTDVRLGRKTLGVAVSDYFTCWLTNQYCGKIVSRGPSPVAVIRSGVRHFPFVRPGAALLPIAETALANGIGVSTIAHTRDETLVLWRQTARAMVSRGRVAPTGSGSCDARDYQLATAGTNAIEIAMMRELMEESTVPEFHHEKVWLHKGGDAPIRGTEIIGYFRWVNQGGKPEFVGVSKLSLTRRELFPNEREVDRPADSSLTGGLIEQKARSLSEMHAAIDYFLTLPTLSVPLWVNLLCLKDALKEDPKRWAAFFQITA